MTNESPHPRWLPWLAALVGLNATWTWVERWAIPAIALQRVADLVVLLIVLLPAAGLMLMRDARRIRPLVIAMCVGMLVSIAYRALLPD